MKHRLYYGTFLFTMASALQSPHANAAATDSYSLGVEAFYDHYREPEVDVTENAGYGSVTGNYTHNFGSIFGAVDGRASYGRDDYSSPDGTDSGIPQYEFEGRIRTGTNISSSSGTLSPYVGLGIRYFVDEGKDTVTTLGYSGYDRRITQLYAPIGVTYTLNMSGNWMLAPNIEYDPLITGNVNSRLQNDDGYNINNTQHSGYGLRGELMLGQQSSRSTGMGWELGPFIRYWNIKDSDVTTAPDGSQWIEPHNNRLQAGLALRAMW